MTNCRFRDICMCFSDCIRWQTNTKKTFQTWKHIKSIHMLRPILWNWQQHVVGKQVVETQFCCYMLYTCCWETHPQWPFWVATSSVLVHPGSDEWRLSVSVTNILGSWTLSSGFENWKTVARVATYLWLHDLCYS